MRNWYKISIFLCFVIFFTSGKIVRAQVLPPVVLGQTPNPITINEEQTFEVTPSSLIVTYVGTGTLSVQVNSGSNYTVSDGNKITPALDYSGPLTAELIVTDGTQNSLPYNLNVTVDPVNDHPTLDAITNVSVAEDAAQQAVSLTGITAGGGESQTLTVSASNDRADLLDVFGVSYTSPETTGSLNIKPKANVSGTATVTVTVADNGSNTPPNENQFSRTFTYTITAVNDPPGFDAISDVNINEDVASQAITITGISAGPSESQTVTMSATSANTVLIPNPVVTYDGTSSTATLTFQPQPNQFGSAVVTVKAVDSGTAEFTRTFTINVAAINDAPTLNAISNVSVQEDAAQQSIALAGITAGPSETQTLTVTASTDKPELFDVFEVLFASPQPTGTLNIHPKANVSGTATVTVTITDNGSTGAPNVNTVSKVFTFDITPVNDAPTLDPVNNVTINEDAAQQSIPLSGISAGPSETQTLTVTATSNHPELFDVFDLVYASPQATGSLNVQPKANVSGTAMVTVTVTDNGSNTSPNVNTLVRTFTIEIAPINDPPTLNAITNVTVAEDAAQQAIPLSGISAGPLETQTLNITVSSNKPELFDVLGATYTSPAAAGTLNVRSKPNAFGTASITVTVTDNGSNGAPNVNSISQTFTFDITPVNDPPSFDAIGNVNINEDAAVQSVTITNVSPGPLESQTVTITATSGNTALIPNPTVTYDGTSSTATLSFQPVANQFGSAVITVKGVDTELAEVTRTFTVTVASVNDAPTLDAISNVTVNEDAAQQAIALTGISAGPLESQTLTVTATSDNAALFDVFSVVYSSPQASGTLNIRPKANLFGPASVTVTVTDNGSNVAPNANTFSRTFTFNVTPVNDPPVFNAIADVNINEDATAQNVSVTGISPGPEETSQTMTFAATSSNTTLIPNPSVTYNGTAATASLSFQPLANQFGSSVITVKATDSESGEFTRTFTVNVADINDAPTLDAISDVTVQEDAAQQAVALTGISAGPSESQTLSVTASTDKPTLFDVFGVVYTSAQPSGTLNIHPKANATGTATVTVKVTDNGGNASPNVNSVTRTFTFTITPVNDPPVIKGQNSVSVNEDQSITIQLSHLQIEDPDNASGFILSVSSGLNYSVVGNTITPTLNFNGTLSVPVTVSDGSSTSEPFNLQVVVNPVNDAPQIIGQTPISIGEAQPVTLTLSHLTVLDPDNIYPADFTLNVLSGSNYSITGTTVTPVANFSGVLQVRVFVNDGLSNSNTYNLQILVNSVNDPPVITGQKTALNVNEDQSITLQVTQLNISDPDNTYPGDFTLTVLPGTNYTFSNQTVTPALNFNGTLSVAVSVSDGLSSSTPFNMQITVNAVNDPPVITGQKVLSTNEDQPITLKLTDLTVTDPDNTYPGSFTMTVSTGTNYTASGLTITPALDFSGTLSVPVTVNDGGSNSNTFTVQIQVLSANDAPVITGQDPSPVTITEDQTATIAFANLKVTDSDNTYPTGFSIQLQPGTNYTFSGTTVTPVKDFTGTLSVGVTVNDGTSNSAPYNFQIKVNPVNDPPVITGQKTLTVNEDESITINVSDLVVTDPDNKFPDDFTLTILPGTNYTNSGTTVQPAANFFGTLTVNVQVSDGAATSPAFGLQVQVTPVNDPPTFDPIADVSLDENANTYAVTVTGISSGPLESQQLHLTASSGNTSLISTVTVSYNNTGPTATLSFKPQQNQTGDAVITVTVVDPGLSEFTRTFTVHIVNINDPPTLNAISYGPIQEDAPQQSIPLSGITAGPNENQTLTVTAVTTKPELFEVFDVTYQSPQTTGTLKVKPKANAFGSASITVKVTDDGSNDPPNVNFVSRTFTLTIEPVNDPPVITSTPGVVAIIGEPYEYLIESTDADPGETITITAPQKPAWLTLTSQGAGKALLMGTPPSNAGGSVAIKVQVKDAANATGTQEYTLEVDTRPVVNNFSISLNEDVSTPLGTTNFQNAFTDADNNALNKVRIVTLPHKGQLLLGTQPVAADVEIDQALLGNLNYKPDQDFFGKDTLVWNASDGLAYATNSAKIFFDIKPVNDPPVISKLEDTVLEFSVGEGPGVISTEFEATDVDDDSLSSAEIGFRRQNFDPGEDILIFENTPLITGSYDQESGILTLNGKAPIADYITAIRGIKYDNVSQVFSSEEVLKTVSYTISDGKALSVTRDRELRLVDNFVELKIPNAFTPNNDGSNDTWAIQNIDRHTNVTVRVYNARGQEVFASEGEYNEWDGTYMGLGQLLPIDTYYYTIDLNLPFRKKTYKGSVLILRGK